MKKGAFEKTSHNIVIIVILKQHKFKHMIDRVHEIGKSIYLLNIMRLLRTATSNKTYKTCCNIYNYNLP